MQLPTDESWRAGKLTHELYEVLRREDELPPRRVHAFLEMLAINKRLGIEEALPPDTAAFADVKEATFAKWIGKNHGVWRDYEAWLERNGRTFPDVAAEFGLTHDDFPGLRAGDRKSGGT